MVTIGDSFFSHSSHFAQVSKELSATVEELVLGSGKIAKIAIQHEVYSKMARTVVAMNLSVY